MYRENCMFFFTAAAAAVAAAAAGAAAAATVTHCRKQAHASVLALTLWRHSRNSPDPIVSSHLHVSFTRMSDSYESKDSWC